MADCFGEIRKLWDEKEVPNDVILKMIDDINDIKNQLIKSGKIDELSSRTQAYLKNLKELTAAQRRERAENISKKLSLQERIAQFDSKKEGILSTIGNSAVLIPGARVSAENMARSQKGRLLNMLSMGLERDGLLKIAQSGTLDREISAAMFSLGKGETPIIKITEEAWKIAKTFHAINKEILLAKRAAGVNVGEVFGYIKQTHDPKRIREAGFSKWLNDITPHLDIEKTFGDLDPSSKESLEMMKKIYDQITDGKYGFIPNAPVADDLVTVFKKSRLGDKLKRNRALHFKDGDGFHEYNSNYGKKGLFSTINSEIDNASRQIGLISIFGTDPQATMEALIKQHDLSEGDASGIRSTYKVVQGFSNLGGDSIKAKVGAGLRAWQNISKLGLATISSMGDWATSAAMLRTNFGTGYLGGMGKLMDTYLRSIPAENRKIWAQRLGLYLEDMVNQIHASNDFGAHQPGMLSEMQRWSFKLSGLELHTSVARLAAGRQFAMDLADMSYLSFEALPKRSQANLSMYGIDKNDWAFMKNAVEDIQGFKAMTPEALEEIDLSFFKQFQDIKYEGKKYKPKPEEIRREMSNKLRSFLSDNAELAVPQPGVRTKAIILGDTEQDTWRGQFWRFVGQFKSFPLTVHEVFSRVALGNPDSTNQSMADAIFKGKGDIQGMVGFMLTSTMIGYLSTQTKNVVKGEGIDLDPSLEDLQKAMHQGGALGLYGDFMFGNYKNAYNSPGMLKVAKNIAGPVLSEAFDVGQLFIDAKQAWSDDPGRKPSKKQVEKQLITLVKRNTPYGNMFWSKWALDKYIFDQMYEAADPGYSMRKKNRNKNKDNWQFKGP